MLREKIIASPKAHRKALGARAVLRQAADWGDPSDAFVKPEQAVHFSPSELICLEEMAAGREKSIPPDNPD